MRVMIQPARALQPAHWTTPPETADFRGLSAAANLPEHVITRQRDRLAARLGWPVPIEPVQAPSSGQGSLVFLWGPRAGFSALGARGKRAETVADEVADAFLRFQTRRGTVDCHPVSYTHLTLPTKRIV